MSDDDRFKRIMNEADSLLGKFPENEKKQKPEKAPEPKPARPKTKPVGTILWDFFTKPLKESNLFNNPSYGLSELNQKPEEIEDYVSAIQVEDAQLDKPAPEVPVSSGDDDVE